MGLKLILIRNKNKKLEELVLKNADCVLTVSNTLKKEFSKSANRVEVLTNGFDDEFMKSAKVALDEKFTISYIGMLPKQSNPKKLFRVLQLLCSQNKNFKNDLQLNFIGDISDSVKRAVLKNQLANNTRFINYVDHSKAIEYQRGSKVSKGLFCFMSLYVYPCFFLFSSYY